MATAAMMRLRSGVCAADDDPCHHRGARWAVSSTVRLCKRDVRVVAVAVVLLVVLDLRVRCLAKAGSSSSD